MAITGSGQIRLSDIQTEFGGANPIGLSEYYSGGSYVLSGGSIPSTGQIRLSDFYGASAALPAVGYFVGGIWSGSGVQSTTTQKLDISTETFGTELTRTYSGGKWGMSANAFSYVYWFNYDPSTIAGSYPGASDFASSTLKLTGATETFTEIAGLAVDGQSSPPYHHETVVVSPTIAYINWDDNTRTNLYVAKFTFSSETEGSVTALADHMVSDSGAIYNTTKGWWYGGRINWDGKNSSYTIITAIRSIVYSTETLSVLGVTVADDSGSFSSFSNSTAGYMVGQVSETVGNWQKFLFSTETASLTAAYTAFIEPDTGRGGVWGGQYTKSATTGYFPNYFASNQYGRYLTATDTLGSVFSSYQTTTNQYDVSAGTIGGIQ